MKSLLISALVVAGLVAILYRTRQSGQSPRPPSEAFLRRCSTVVEPELGAQRADVYCRCLAAKDVTDVAQTISTPAGRAAETECRASLAASTGTIPTVRSPMPVVPAIKTRSEEPPPTPQ